MDAAKHKQIIHVMLHYEANIVTWKEDLGSLGLGHPHLSSKMPLPEITHLIYYWAHIHSYKKLISKNTKIIIIFSYGNYKNIQFKS